MPSSLLSNCLWEVEMKTLDFIPLNHYMFRTSFFSLNKYAQYFVNKQYNSIGEATEVMKSVVEDPHFREALAVASFSLYESIPLLWSEDNKRRENTLRGLIRYLIRMTSRTTPFGLFSGVSIGKWHDENSVVINSNPLEQKKVRPDMEWIVSIIKVLENEDDILLKTVLSVNSTIVDYKSRIKIPNLSIHAENVDKEQTDTNTSHLLHHSTIRNTEAVVFVKDVLMKEKTTFEGLLEKMQDRFTTADKATLFNFIKELIRNEYLLTNLRTPLLIPSSLNYLIEWLVSNAAESALLPTLKIIDQDIKRYEQMEFGEGEEMVCSIIKKMKSVHNCKSPLQIDMSIDMSHNQLSYSLKEDISKATEVIWMLSNKRNFQYINNYHVEFMDKYGIGNEVPLLELLEVDLGIGAPYSYEHPLSILPESGFNEMNKMHPLFYQLYEQCLRNQEIEIDLKDEDLDVFTKDYKEIENEVTPPSSVEMCFSIHADSSEAVNRGDYKLVIGANQGSYGMGKIFGRFSHLLQDSYEPLLTEIQDVYTALNDQAIFAEVTYLPKMVRHANVVSNQSIFKYEIPIGTHASMEKEAVIPVSDIVVIADEKRMYLKSKKHNKEVIPFTSHMYSSLAGTPNLYRFLCDMGINRLGPYPLFDLPELDKFSFVPRIKYKNIILNSATWKIGLSSIEFRNVKGIEEFRQAFRDWKKSNLVPRFVYLTEQDARILFDLDNPLFIDDLYKEFTKLDEYLCILLTEAYENFDGSWIKDTNKQNYNAEFVFPMYSRSAKIEKKDFYLSTNEQLVYLPGQEWLYLKLYCSVDQSPQLIEEVCAFINKLYDTDYVECGFYVNYIDPRNHVRFRLKDKQKKLFSNMQIIMDWTSYLRSEGIIQNVVYDTYLPESHRYGGNELMQSAETFFMYDSLAAGKLRKVVSDLIDPLDMAIISFCDLYESMFIDSAHPVEALSNIVNYKNFIKEFRVRRKKLIRLWSYHKNNDVIDMSEAEKEISDILKWRNSGLKDYYSRLKESMVTNYEDIVFSILHMHVNRLYGTDRNEEKKIMTLARHLLNNYEIIKKIEITK